MSSSTTRHVVIENEIRWPAQVWEHDGDEPIALFMHADDAHLFNAAPDLVEALQGIMDAYGDCDDMSIVRCKAALAKAGVTS